jgi:RimK family alpha-L-glutamate ligase
MAADNPQDRSLLVRMQRAPAGRNLGVVESTAGIVAVVAWKELPTNLPLVHGWRRLGIQAELLTPVAARRRLGPGDVALVRLDVTPELDGVEPGLADMAELPARGVRLLNRPAALLAAHDKLETARRLGAAGISHPRTLLHERRGELRGLELPLVLKPRFGSWGTDLMLCRTTDELERCLAVVRERAWFDRHGVLIQELVPPAGHDLRIIVAGSTIVGATRRDAAPGEWRTNVALGGRARPAHPSPQACALALETARVIGADLCGVDLLPTPGGQHVVIEINAAVDVDHEDSLAGGDFYADAAAALSHPVRRQPFAARQ